MTMIPCLSEILQVDLSPFYNNLIVSQLMLLWFKFGLEFLYRQHQQQRPTAGGNNKEGGRVRQRLALLLSSALLFWPLFDRSRECWSWRLNTLVPLSLMGRLIYKGAILKDAEDVEVQCFSRSSALPSELLLGPLQWMTWLIYFGLYRFNNTNNSSSNDDGGGVPSSSWHADAQAVVTVAAIFIGDSWLAPVVGQNFGRHFYQMPLARRKTMEGSLLGVFLGTCIGSYGLLTVLGLELPPLRIMLVYGALAALAEGMAPGHWDNLAIGLVLQAAWDRVPLWFPPDSVAVVPVTGVTTEF